MCVLLLRPRPFLPARADSTCARTAETQHHINSAPNPQQTCSDTPSCNATAVLAAAHCPQHAAIVAAAADDNADAADGACLAAIPVHMLRP